MTRPPNLVRGSIGLDLRGIPEGSHPVVLDGGDASLVLDPSSECVLESFRFEGELFWRAGDRRVAGTLAGRVRIACDRCLVPFVRGIEAPVEIALVLAPEEAPGDEDGVVAVSAEDPVVDLSGPFREAALVELPIKNVCRDDCRGLCPACGANRNEVACACATPSGDPRWDALKGMDFPTEQEE